MSTKSIFERLRDGETIHANDTEGFKLRDASFATKELLVQMNNSSNPTEIRNLLSQITGSEIDKSVDVFTTLYINYGKHTKIGKNVITVNTQTFTATLLDNNSAKAFREMLPLKTKMIDLNGNEKYCDLQKSLPTDPFNPKTIKNGDLMLYGAETLVLFYKTFSTSYSYTKLAEVDDATGLSSAFGSRDTRVTFELE